MLTAETEVAIEQLTAFMINFFFILNFSNPYKLLLAILAQHNCHPKLRR
jgi:hypothetical protein